MPPKTRPPCKDKAKNGRVAALAKLLAVHDGSPRGTIAFDLCFDAVKDAKSKPAQVSKAVARTENFCAQMRAFGIGHDPTVDGHVLPKLKLALYEHYVMSRTKIDKFLSSADYVAVVHIDPEAGVAVDAAAAAAAGSGGGKAKKKAGGRSSSAAAAAAAAAAAGSAGGGGGDDEEQEDARPLVGAGARSRARKRGAAAAAAAGSGGGKDEEGVDDDGDDGDDDGQPAAKRHRKVAHAHAAPAKMTVAMLKAELKAAGLRGVPTLKADLVKAVERLRATPQPDPADRIFAHMTVLSESDCPTNDLIRAHGGRVVRAATRPEEVDEVTHVMLNAYTCRLDAFKRHNQAAASRVMPMADIRGGRRLVLDRCLPMFALDTDGDELLLATDVQRAVAEGEQRAEDMVAQLDGIVSNVGNRDQWDNPEVISRIKGMFPLAQGAQWETQRNRRMYTRQIHWGEESLKRHETQLQALLSRGAHRDEVDFRRRLVAQVRQNIDRARQALAAMGDAGGAGAGSGGDSDSDSDE